MAYQKPLVSSSSKIQSLPSTDVVNHGDCPSWDSTVNWTQLKRAISMRSGTNLACSQQIATIVTNPNITSITAKWAGCTLAENGSIYGIPFNSTTVLKIDPATDVGITFGNLNSDTSKWYGGVLAENGSIYGIPYNSSTILKIDTATDTITTFGDITGTRYAGGVLAANGMIYGMPRSDIGCRYTYYKTITISHTNVSSDLTNFPLCVQLNADTDVGTACQLSGNDIRFTDNFGDALYFEKANFSITGGAATGIFWVRVTTVSSTADTIIRMYYGNQYAISGSSTSTWDSTFGGVWHLGDGTTLSAADSTVNANTGTITGVTAAAGKIDGCATGFARTSAYKIALNNSASLQTPVFTYEAWVYLTETTVSTAHTVIGGSSNAGQQFTVSLDGSGNVVVVLLKQQYVGWASTGTLTANAWHHVAATYDASGNYYFYIDGTPAGNGTDLQTFSTSVRNIGWCSNSNEAFAGSLDEVRISNTVRSAAWMAFQYANQVAANGELTIGIQQNTPGAILKIDTTTDTATTFGTTLPTMYNWYGGVLAPDGMIYGIPYSSAINDFGYAYCKTITISHTNVSSDLTNFPLCVQLNADTDVGAACLSTGNDIRFTDSSNNILYAELDSFVITGGAATGAFWVKIPTVSSTADTVIFMYYGNQSATALSTTTSTWDAYFKSVYHFGNGSTLSVSDSTSFANTGTNASVTAASGKLGGCGYWNGSANIAIPAAALPAVNSAWTISTWIKASTPSTSRNIIDNTTNAILLYYTANGSTNSLICLKQNVKQFATSTSGYPIDTWSHIAITWNGTSVLTYYINGAAAGGDTSALSFANMIEYIGGNDAAHKMLGYLDEFRISTTVRSTAWLSFEYLNQNTVNGGLTVGSQQINGAFLKIDPTTDTATTFGSIPGATTNAGWIGGVLAPNGSIYSIPYTSTSVLKMTPSTSIATTFGSLTGTDKWVGGALAPNGIIYGIPYSSATVLKIDPTTDIATTFGSVGAGTLKWAGGVMTTNGTIYSMPYNTTTFLKIGAPMIDIQIDFPLARYFNKF
ncbi:MAG: DUF2341 domain-containing protein [Candidatus Cloacimonetes bacterium]|jgi:hypothetical protein|nr:DUF2341 domain-containing protein [Candidatus Cloacimonadota bacterium]